VTFYTEYKLVLLVREFPKHSRIYVNDLDNNIEQLKWCQKSNGYSNEVDLLV